MEKESDKMMITFEELLYILDDDIVDDFNLSNAGIEVIVNNLESQEIHAKSMNAARTLREKGKVVLGIGILPFLTVGERVVRESLERASAFRRAVDGCILLNKESLCAKPGIKPYEVDSHIQILVNNVEQGLRDILKFGKPFITASILKDELRDCGIFTVAIGKGEGENRLEDAFSNALNAPEWSHYDLNTARGLVVKVLIPFENPLSEEEEAKFKQMIADDLPDIEGIAGISPSAVLSENQLKVIILSTGTDIVHELPA